MTETAMRFEAAMEKIQRNETMEFTDRYQALGIPYPDPRTVCKGQCEGTGWVPVYKPPRRNKLIEMDQPKEMIDLWWKQHRKVNWWKRLLWWSGILKFDGWHFVVCPRCNGTRLECGSSMED